MTANLLRPNGSLAEGNDPVLLTPDDAGWIHSGLRVLAFDSGESRMVDTGAFEMVVLPLSGSIVVECEGERFDLEGRDSVFSRVTDFAYVPCDASVTLTSGSGGEFALCMAKTSRKLTPKYGPVDGVKIETRGAGPATRQMLVSNRWRT